MKKLFIFLPLLFLLSSCSSVKPTEPNITEEPATMRNEKNKIENLYQFIHWDWGQNYPFNGCMAFTLECLGEDKDVYDYWFFAGVGGDNFTMCYGDNGFLNDCRSVCIDGFDFIEYVLGEIGYGYNYVTGEQINADKDKYVGMAMDYIDKGIPVLVKGAFGEGEYPWDANFTVLYSYSDFGGKLMATVGSGRDYPTYTIDTTKEITDDWIFMGERINDPPLAQVYRNAVMKIPYWLTMPKDSNGVTFGAEAFRDWADDIENGRYDGLTSETFKQWDDYTIFVCNLATNSGGCQGFFQKAQELNPDLTFLSDVREQYRRTSDLWNELEAVGGGFNITAETLQNTEKRGIIADKIREFADCMDEVVNIYNKIPGTD